MPKLCLNVLTCLGLTGILWRAVGGFDPNCVQLPPMKELVSCCKFPELNLGLFEEKCKNEAQKSSLFGLTGYYNHCTIACIFKISKILEANGDLNLLNVQTLLASLMRREPAFEHAYLTGFRTCVPLIRQKIQRRMKRQRKWPLFGRSNCSKVPLMFVICAHAEVFINCPPYAWTRSAQCNRTREYLRNCKQK